MESKETLSSSVLLQLEQISPNLKNKNDTLAFVLHLCMKQSGFIFVGCSDKNDETGSELTLPLDWNKHTDSYTFRYKHDTLKSTVLLNVIVLGGQLLIHVMLIENKNMFHLDINIDEFVKDDTSLDNLITLFKLQIIDHLLSPICHSIYHTTRENGPPKNEPTHIYAERPARHLPTNPWIIEQECDPYSSQFGVGRNDVFPDIPSGPSGLWKGTGPGTLIGPGHSGFKLQFPDQVDNVQGHPQGARFDPFGPPGTGNRFGTPDKDDLPPPKGGQVMTIYIVTKSKT